MAFDKRTGYSRFNNKFPQRCADCGISIEIGAHVYGTKEGQRKWRIICPDCHSKMAKEWEDASTVVVESDKLDGQIIDSLKQFGDKLQAELDNDSIDALKYAFGAAKEISEVYFDEEPARKEKARGVEPKKPAPGLTDLINENAEWGF
jgi:DNA-directed RNA polymerase subunit RPC12/RpoP